MVIVLCHVEVAGGQHPAFSRSGRTERTRGNRKSDHSYPV
jgi:hypothetical protein